MHSLNRYIQKQVLSDLGKKMVFVAGPRQVGKTTFAKALPGGRSGYLNWDVPGDRERILKRRYPLSPLWIFDEIHKYRSWRNYLKGLYDSNEHKNKILVTGSAKLDYYRFGGDSLQGRYHFIRMHPLSVAELGINTQKDFQQLLLLGGFPEPFLSGSAAAAKRWSTQYRTRLIHEEISTLESVSDLGNMELLMLRLPDCVGSPLSINSLREDIQVGFKAISNWIRIFERIYAVFRLPPFGAPRIRAVKKEQKHYHFDWTIVRNDGARFENLVACHLLKWAQFREDVYGDEVEIRYFRDTDGREVDFVVLEDRRPVRIIECKLSADAPSPHLKYFKERFAGCDAWQLSATGTDDYVTQSGIRVCNALVFLKTLV
ncbi:MAG: hypothetical protein A2583_15835 [Bdellovibrionales bacterium RIFOXYD1_FULL_53_11]|nr:MAG: hypothetical protein A2583_15835 [Bdellovibrionales bacterium RIFOXYD1_FULL_53_11]